MVLALTNIDADKDVNAVAVVDYERSVLGSAFVEANTLR